VRIYGGSNAVLDGVEQICRKYDRMFSKTNPVSDVWKLNNSEGSPVEVNTETAEVIELALYYSEISDNRFDVTCGAITSLWDFKSENPVLPSAEQLAQAVRTVGTDNVSVDGNIVTLVQGTQIDLGGIAKGYIADKVAEYLRGEGIKNAVINFGGNVVVVGDKFGEQFNIGVQSPFADGNIDAVRVSDCSVVTAGIYQRGFYLDSMYYHHIIDVTSGMPAESDVVSVTVISQSSAHGDALATVLYLLGSEDGLELAESLDGVEALFITNDGEIIKTSGL